MLLQHTQKRDNQDLKNYYPISLLPAAGEIFERISYDNIGEFFTENNLISLDQSDFKPGDSSINQLLFITHKICKSFENGLEVWGIFLDISKAFDKVRHKGPLYKLKLNGISGKLFDIITNFLNIRNQRVVLNGQYDSWVSIEAVVPQGSILGPLLLFIYVNDLSNDLLTNVELFADDASLFSIVHNMNTSTTNLSNNLKKIKNWAIQRNMNFKQTQEVIFPRKL